MVVEKVPPGHELRFETAARGAPIVAEIAASDRVGSRRDAIKILSGAAEVCGLELTPGHEFPLLPGRSYGVFSWYGCEVELDDEFCKEVYTAEESTMPMVAKLHHNLELMRARAASSGGDGPRLAVVGPATSGKSTLVRTLQAYAVRAGRRPTMVDLDVRINSIGLPGTVAADLPTSQLDLFGESGDLDFTPRNPLIYFSGAEKITENAKRFRELTAELAKKIDARMQAAHELGPAGLVIDTPPWAASASAASKTLVSALQSLRVNAVVVIRNDRLFKEMKDAFPGMPVVKVGQSGGLVDRDEAAVKHLASDRIKWYFDGIRGQLSPVRETFVLGKDLFIYQARSAVVADAALRPIGSDEVAEEKIPQINVVDKKLESSVLAVLHASSEDEVLTANAAGFVLVESVSIADNSLTLSLPCPGGLKSKYLVYGKIKYFEHL